MNRFQVQDAWMRHHVQSRDEADAARRARERECSVRAAEAWEWCLRALPDLVIDGRPCGWAVKGAMALRRQLGVGNVSASAVRAWRLERMPANQRAIFDEVRAERRARGGMARMLEASKEQA